MNIQKEGRGSPFPAYIPLLMHILGSKEQEKLFVLIYIFFRRRGEPRNGFAQLSSFHIRDTIAGPFNRYFQGIIKVINKAHVLDHRNMIAKGDVWTIFSLSIPPDDAGIRFNM